MCLIVIIRVYSPKSQRSVFQNIRIFTADLAMVQKMIIDTLHKEGKSQGSLLKGVAVQGVLYE